MAIAYRSETHSGTTSNTVSVVKPAGAIAGDVLIVDIVTNNATVTVVPSGWTAVTNVQTGLAAKMFAYYHVVGDPDPGPWDFTLSASVARSSICACYSGVDNTTPLDVAATTVGSNTAGTSIVVPAVSPVTANTMLHSGVGEGATNRTITHPTGMTSIFEQTAGRRQEAAWQALSATGSTGTRTWTFSNTAVYNAYMVPLRPAPPPAGSVTFRDSTVAAQASATTWTINRPTNAVAGDLLIAFMVLDTTTPVVSTAPAGWTQFVDSPRTDDPLLLDVQMVAYWRICPASPPASWDWVFNAAAVGSKAMLAYFNVDQTTPIHAQEMIGTAAATLHDTALLTTTIADCMLVIGGGADESATFTPYFTPPAGWTERIDFEAPSSFVEIGAFELLLSGTISGQRYSYTHVDSDSGANFIIAIAKDTGAPPPAVARSQAIWFG